MRPRSAGLLLGVALDAVLSDPRRGHPVAAFGRIAQRAERALYRDSRAAGAVYAGGLVALAAAGSHVVTRRRAAGVEVAWTAITVWTALGGTSLRRRAAEIATLVDARDLPRARQAVGHLVARRTDDLTLAEVVRAATESVAENTADADVGTLVWTAMAGPAGAVAHRAANTLDAMVGYRDERYGRFGWAAARLDDALGLVASRVSAVSTALAAGLTGDDAGRSLRTWLRDGSRHPSPNAGQVEAAFAGALGVSLGGVNDYGGRTEARPVLGDGPRPTAVDLHRAVVLSRTTTMVATALCVWAIEARAWR